jgi:hypothetical protein
VEQLRRYAFPIVADSNEESPWGVLKFNLDPAGLGMAECIEQRLTPNPIRFTPDQWMQTSGPTLDYDMARYLRSQLYFLWNA